MNEVLYFFDTYAFFEIERGNPDYKKFREIEPITTIFNLAEFNFALKREGKTTADAQTNKCAQFLVDVIVQDVMEATTLRMKNRKMSIPDVIGYTVAKRMNAVFVTGDQEFKNLPNVEFIK